MAEEPGYDGIQKEPLALCGTYRKNDANMTPSRLLIVPQTNTLCKCIIYVMIGKEIQHFIQAAGTHIFSICSWSEDRTVEASAPKGTSM